jgi:predicted GNAT family N-acyltransferase
MFRIVTTQDDLLKCFCVRAIVFVQEQRVPYALEVDEFEYSALHILGELQDEPMASGRIRFLGAYAKLERIAIRDGYRGHGYGHQLVEFMMGVARERGFGKFKMHAQAHLADFYAKHGFIKKGELFEEAGIAHYLMVKE